MVIPSNFACADSTRSSDKRSSGKLPSQEPTALSSPFLLADNMRDFDTSGRSSDAVQVFTPCPIHCQGYRRPFFPTGLATDTAPGLATDAQARRNISHYQFIVNTTGCLLSPLSERIWGAPVCTGTTGGGGAPGRRRAHPQSSFPQRREGGGDGFPSPRERRTHPGGGGNPRPPYRHSRDGGNPFPAAGGRRGWVPVSTGTTGAPTIVIPATAGIHGGIVDRWMGSRRAPNRH